MSTIIPSSVCQSIVIHSSKSSQKPLGQSKPNSFGASMDRGGGGENESLLEGSGSHDQGGNHARIL